MSSSVNVSMSAEDWLGHGVPRVYSAAEMTRRNGLWVLEGALAFKYLPNAPGSIADGHRSFEVQVTYEDNTITRCSLFLKSISPVNTTERELDRLLVQHHHGLSGLVGISFRMLGGGLPHKAVRFIQTGVFQALVEGGRVPHYVLFGGTSAHYGGQA